MHDNINTATAVSPTIENTKYELMIRGQPIAYHFERMAFSTVAFLTLNSLATSATAFLWSPCLFPRASMFFLTALAIAASLTYLVAVLPLRRRTTTSLRYPPSDGSSMRAT